MPEPKNFPSDYSDIIDLPHPVSTSHPQMPVSERAAQFSPFAALTGHQEALRETARVTEEKTELDESVRNQLDQKLQHLLKQTPPQTVTVTYFQKDPRKSGGSYLHTSGILKGIDSVKHTLLLKEHPEIPVEDIVAIESPFSDSPDTAHCFQSSCQNCHFSERFQKDSPAIIFKDQKGDSGL